MTDMKIVEPRLRWFVKIMRKKLAMPKNVAKTDWRELSILKNIRGIKDEYNELIQAWTFAVPSNDEIDAMILECADIANRAMMLADQLNEMIKGNKSKLQ